jgi:MFS family permease
MFHLPAFRGAVLATTAMTFGMYGVLFLVPLTWQSTGALDATGAGLALMPMAVVFVVVSPFSEALSQRVGARLMTGGGVAVIGLGLLLLGATAGWRSLWLAEAGLALTGLGMGLATGPLLGVAVGAVGSARSGTAGAIINVARMTGATLGVAILGTVFAGAQGGTVGLRVAMLLGGFVQLVGAAVAWRDGRRQTTA